MTAQNADLLVSAITSGAVNLPSTEAKGFVLPALHLQLSATATTTVEAITVSSSGTGDESAIGQVQLFQDLDEDGVVGASDPQLGATEVFSADDGAVTFTGLGLTLAASQRTVLLVVIETPTGAAEGDTFQLSLADADAITATTVVGPGDVRPVPVFGTPLLGAVKTVSLTGSLQILLGPASPAAPRRSRTPRTSRSCSSTSAPRPPKTSG